MRRVLLAAAVLSSVYIAPSSAQVCMALGLLARRSRHTSTSAS